MLRGEKQASCPYIVKDVFDRERLRFDGSKLSDCLNEIYSSSCIVLLVAAEF